MNIEEMQTIWSEMTEKLENQERLTNTLIMDMTKEKFRKKISRISRYESVGAILCFVMALYVVLSINKLDTWYLLTSGIVVSAYLVIFPLLILRYVQRMKTIDLVSNTYTESLVEFAKRRKQFLLMQRIGLGLNFFLMLLILPVSAKVLGGKNLFIESNSNVWIFYIAGMLMLIIPVSLWGYRSYKRMTASAEILLQDLKS